MDGISKTRLYGIFCGMKDRCYNPKNKHYQWYGGKGVTVCAEWLGESGVSSFMEWALNSGYEEHLTIDRIDASGPYSPENCRWITRAENSSRAHRSEISSSPSDVSGKIRLTLATLGMTEAELARKLGKSPQALSNKLKRGRWKESEIREVAAAMGCKYRTVFRFPDGTVI